MTAACVALRQRVLNLDYFPFDFQLFVEKIIINHLVDKLEYEGKMSNPRKYNKKPIERRNIIHFIIS